VCGYASSVFEYVPLLIGLSGCAASVFEYVLLSIGLCVNVLRLCLSMSSRSMSGCAASVFEYVLLLIGL
jgi:hypothetical protein